MKKEYIKPKLVAKAYAQFENVFTLCDKGNAVPRGCSNESGWPPRPAFDAAYRNNIGS